MTFLPDLDLHYICGAVLFVSSVLGCGLPYQKIFDVTPVRPLSTGIIFGVAICHLLPDSGQILDTVRVTEWFLRTTRLQGTVGDDGLYDTLPVAEGLMCLGVFIMLVIDQCIPCPHHQVQDMTPTTPTTTGGVGDDEDLHNGEMTRLLSSHHNGNGADGCCSGHHDHHHHHGSIATDGHVHGHHNGHGHGTEHGSGYISDSSGDSSGTTTNGAHHHNHQQQRLPNAKVYATEVAIAIHSVIIGFTMGVNPHTGALVGFTVAMVFHQVFEGIALAMIAQQGRLTTRALFVLVTVFASSLPTGIVIGRTLYNLAEFAKATAGAGDAEDVDLVDVDDEEEGADLFTLFFQGVPNAIASGMLLHIGFELMMEDFHHHHHHYGGENKGRQKFPAFKLALAFLGGASIIFLAIWA